MALARRGNGDAESLDCFLQKVRSFGRRRKNVAPGEHARRRKVVESAECRRGRD